MSKKNQVRRAQQRQQPRPKKPTSQPTTTTTPKPGRHERLEEARRTRRRRSLLVRAAVAVVVVVVVGGLAAWKLLGDRAERQAIAAMTAGDCRFDRRSDPGAVNEHAANPTFRVDPPSGGVHDPGAASPGDYDAASTPPDGQMVHALEHGDIVLWYRDDLPEPDLERLQAMVDDEPDLLLAPRPGMNVTVAALAWHKRLLCDSLDLDAVQRFIDRYADQGPERQPEDASGGAGSVAAGAWASGGGTSGGGAFNARSTT